MKYYRFPAPIFLPAHLPNILRLPSFVSPALPPLTHFLRFCCIFHVYFFSAQSMLVPGYLIFLFFQRQRRCAGACGGETPQRSGGGGRGERLQRSPVLQERDGPGRCLQRNTARWMCVVFCAVLVVAVAVPLSKSVQGQTVGLHTEYVYHVLVEPMRVYCACMQSHVQS